MKSLLLSFLVPVLLAALILMGGLLASPTRPYAQTWYWWPDTIYEWQDEHGFGYSIYVYGNTHTRVLSVTPEIQTPTAAVQIYYASYESFVRNQTSYSGIKEIISDVTPYAWRDWPPTGSGTGPFPDHQDNEWQYEVIGDTLNSTLDANQTIFYTDERYNLSHGFQLLVCYENDMETDLGLGTHYILPGTRVVQIRRPIPDLGFPIIDPLPPFNNRRIYLKAGYSVMK